MASPGRGEAARVSERGGQDHDEGSGGVDEGSGGVDEGSKIR